MEKIKSDFEIKSEPQTLRDFAAIAVASYMCDLHLEVLKKPLMDVRNKDKFGSSNVGFHYNNPHLKVEEAPYLSEMRFAIMESPLLKSYLQFLPEVLASAIQIKILELSEKMYDWIMYVTQDLNLPFSFVDKIFLTSKGVIDVVKIFSFHWISIPPHTPKGKFFTKFNQLHSLACLFGLKYLVKDFQTDLVQQIKRNFPGIQKTDNTDSVFRIMSIVIYCYFVSLEGKQDFTFISIDNLSETNLTAVQMLDICRRYGFYNAFTYFYNHLDAIEEQKYLETTSKKNFSSCSNQFKYGNENTFQIAVFLLKKMNASQQCSFILENFLYIFCNFLKRESYQKFCISLVNKYLLHFRNHHHKVVLKIFVQVLAEKNKYKIDSELHVQILKSLMKNIPKRNKIEFFTRDELKILGDFYEIFNIPSLKVVINDPDLEEEKAQIIHCGKMKFESLIEEKNYKALDKFVAEVLRSKTSHDEFDNVIFCILELKMKNFHSLFFDKYLTWKYTERASSFKVQLYPLWCNLVPKVYVQIEKLMMWCFNKQEMPSVKNCDDHEIIFLKQFCRVLIYNIWFRSKNTNFTDYPGVCSTTSADILSSRILFQVFYSKFTEYKMEELANDESCVRFFCEDALKNFNDKQNFLTGFETHDLLECNFEILDKFFKFCTLSTDKIKEIKRMIAENIKDWVEKYTASENRFYIIVPLLDWIYGEKTENREMLIHHFQERDKVIGYYENRMRKKPNKPCPRWGSKVAARRGGRFNSATYEHDAS